MPAQPGSDATWVDVANLEVQRRLVDVAEMMLTLTYFQIFLGLMGAIGLLATIVYTRRALRQAQESFEHARKIDQQDRRAWLVIRPGLGGDLKINNPHFGVDVDLEIENIGNIPAIEVRWEGMLFVSGGDGDQPRRLDSFWSDTLGEQMEDRRRGSLILPDQNPFRARFFAIGDPKEFSKSPSFQGVGGARIGLCLCLTYTSGSEKARYVTAVGYWLTHKDQTPSLYNNLPSTVPAEELSLVQFEGGFAS